MELTRKRKLTDNVTPKRDTKRLLYLKVFP